MVTCLGDFDSSTSGPRSLPTAHACMSYFAHISFGPRLISIDECIHGLYDLVNVPGGCIEADQTAQVSGRLRLDFRV